MYLLLLSVALLFVACATTNTSIKGADGRTDVIIGSSETTEVAEPAEVVVEDADFEPAVEYEIATPDMPMPEMAIASEPVIESDMVMGLARPALAGGDMAEATSKIIVEPPIGFPEPYEPIQPAPGLLTAGEWSDLDNWDFWLNLAEREQFSDMASYWGYDRVLHRRYHLELLNPSGIPVQGEFVQLLMNDTPLWKGVTDNHGVVELWMPKILYQDAYGSNQLFIEVDGERYAGVVPYEEGINRIVLHQPADAASQVANIQALDIAWVVDATGSMSDELEYLKTELQDVIGQVQATNPNASIAMGSVFYRDIGDEYVTKISPMSGNIQETVDFIGQQRASGGGDFPEAVEAAMTDALYQLDWGVGHPGSTVLSGGGMSEVPSTKLLFLLLDAPPHYGQESQSFVQLMARAAEKGIKVIPIVASGIDKETEFLMRYAAIATNGTYVFITGHSGIGGDHIEPTIGPHSVEYLNDLLVRIIEEAL